VKKGISSLTKADKLACETSRGSAVGEEGLAAKFTTQKAKVCCPKTNYAQAQDWI
jgi:hypothetical protein